jgi:dienelactone hydrolase
MNMAIETRVIEYDAPGGTFEGVIALDTAISGARPGILIAPNFMGQGNFDVERAKRFAAIGYVGFAIDMYGKGRRATDADSAMALMNETTADRSVLQARIGAALALLKAQDEVDPSRTGAIGFCFGGKCVLDLARSGAEVGGVVSFHGIYDAPPFPNAPMKAKVLVCHGWDDPLCPPEAMVGMAGELTTAGVDWQIHAYGHTGHAFTAPGANMPGMMYNAAADSRSWKAMTDFFAEIFG